MQRRHEKAGNQTVAFWVSMFGGITMMCNVLAVGFVNYVVAPIQDKHIREFMDVKIDDVKQTLQEQLTERDRRRQLEITTIRNEITDLKQEVRALRNRVK